MFRRSKLESRHRGRPAFVCFSMQFAARISGSWGNLITAKASANYSSVDLRLQDLSVLRSFTNLESTAKKVRNNTVIYKSIYCVTCVPIENFYEKIYIKIGNRSANLCEKPQQITQQKQNLLTIPRSHVNLIKLYLIYLFLSIWYKSGKHISFTKSISV